MDALAMFWADHQELAARKNKVPVSYLIGYAPLAASAVQSPGQFQASADFVCTRITGVQTTTVTNAAYILTPLIIQMVITARNMNYNSARTEWSTSGVQVNPQSNANPTDLPYPLFIPNMATMSTLLDNPIAVAANVWLTFTGIQCNP